MKTIKTILVNLLIITNFAVGAQGLMAQAQTNDCRTDKEIMPKYGEQGDEIETYIVRTDSLRELDRKYALISLPITCLGDLAVDQVIRIPNVPSDAPRAVKWTLDHYAGRPSCILDSSGSDFKNAVLTVKGFYAGANSTPKRVMSIRERPISVKLKRTFLVDGELNGIKGREGSRSGRMCHNGSRIVLDIGDLARYEPGMTDYLEGKWDGLKSSLQNMARGLTHGLTSK